MEKTRTIINTVIRELCEECTPEGCPRKLDDNDKLPHCYEGEGGRQKYHRLFMQILTDTEKTATKEDDIKMGEILDNAVKK
jgi:hypothetical protein